MKVSILIINYKSRPYLEKCLDSLQKTLVDVFFSFEVILINNEEQALKVDFEKYTFPLKIIENAQNKGFGAANNIGTKHAQGDLLFFLNPDTLLFDDSLKRLVEEIEKNPSIGILAPAIIQMPQNRPQPWTCGKKSTLLRILFKNTFFQPWNQKKTTLVDWVSGTALMIKKADFLALNGFDEKFFMYFEDQDLCLRMKKFSKQVIFYPKAKILHFDGKSWDSLKKKKFHFYQSQNYFFQKHRPVWEKKILQFLQAITKKR